MLPNLYRFLFTNHLFCCCFCNLRCSWLHGLSLHLQLPPRTLPRSLGDLEPLLSMEELGLLYPSLLLLFGLSLTLAVPIPVDEPVLFLPERAMPTLHCGSPAPLAPLLPEASSDSEGFLEQEPTFSPVSRCSTDSCFHPPYLPAW